MSLINFVNRTLKFAKQVALDIKEIRGWVGLLPYLTTINKTNLVEAINEVNAKTENKSALQLLNNSHLDFMHYSNLHLDDSLNIIEDESIHRQIGATNYYMREPFLYVRAKNLPHILKEIISEGYEVELNVGRYLAKRSRKTINENIESDINYDNITDGIGVKHQRAKYRYRRIKATSNPNFHDLVKITLSMVELAIDQKSDYIRLDDFNLDSFFKINLNDVDSVEHHQISPVSAKQKGKRRGGALVRMCFRFRLTKNGEVITTPTLGYLIGKFNHRHHINKAHHQTYCERYIAGGGVVGAYNYDNKMK